MSNQYYAQQGPPQQQNYAMPPPQNYGYQNQQYNPPQQPYPPQNNNYIPEKQNLFNPPKPKWNDIIFALLFIAHFLGFIAVAVLSLRKLDFSGGDLDGDNSNSLTLNRNTAWLLSLICAAGFVVSIVYLMLVRAFTKVIIEITLFLSVALNVAFAVYLWIEHAIAAAIVFSIFAVFSIIAYFFMRKRIPFSVLLLQLVMDIAKYSPSVYVIAIVFAILQAAYSVFWSVVLAATYQTYSPAGNACRTSGGQCSNATLIGLVVFLCFSFYWTSQVISNLSLVTEAGIFGTYYFTGGNAPDGGPLRRVALGSLRRASTYSFGSICFGSLIVAILDLLRMLVNVASAEARESGDIIGIICTCFASCILGCISWAVEFFNRYAYIEIAMYGKPYVGAAKDTWRLIKNRGIDALINDSLVSTVWNIGSFIVGLLCAFFGYIYLKIANPSYAAANSNIYAVVLLYAFFIGFFICNVLGNGALSSGVSTIFVGIAHDPLALQQRSPALYAHVIHHYPQAANPV